MNSLPSKKILLTICVTWTAFILLLSLMPARGIKIQIFPHADKIVHFTWYTCLVFFWALYLTKHYSVQIYVIITAAMVLGVFTELAQSLPYINRTASVWDTLTNSLGALAGWFAFHVFQRQNQ